MSWKVSEEGMAIYGAKDLKDRASGKKKGFESWAHGDDGRDNFDDDIR